MAWCLTTENTTKIKKALKNRDIDPFKLAAMTSLERRTFLEKFVGDSAKQVNALFESKLLLKNQKRGYQTWAKKVAGITPQVRRDLLSRIERMEKVLDPKEEEQFLQDLVSARLRIGVTQEEAKKISDLSKKVVELRDKTDITKPDIPLGRAMLDITEYMNSISGKKADLAANIGNVPRTIMTSLDLSAPLNQGWGMISRKQFYFSLGSMLKYAVSKRAFRDLQAQQITHPLYPTATKAGLRLTELGNKLEKREEAFMSNILDKVPGIAGSQRAYTGFLNKLRMDVFVDLVKKADVAGENVEVGSEATKDLAKVVNDFTGGARVGKHEGSVPLLNAAFFSPRKIWSTVNMLNPVNYVNRNISKTARKARARNLIGSLALSASVIALYSLLTGKRQETDPTSANFGKIREGDTRLDLTGGNSTYASILSRLIAGRIKGSSGVSKKLGTGYAETSGYDLIAQFLRYKLSPNASFLVDVLSKESAIGEKKTVSESAIDRFKPMFLDSVRELLQIDTGGMFGFSLVALFGAGLNTYSQDVDWGEKTSKEMLQFKEKVGENKFKQANNDFNKAYDIWYSNTITTPEFEKLSEEGKGKLITGTKAVLKKKIFEEYDFEYEEVEKTEAEEAEADVIKELKPEK